MNNMSVGVNDDYACLYNEGMDFLFYYGYEHTNDKEEWLFVVEEFGTRVFTKTAKELMDEAQVVTYESFGYEPAKILLLGIGIYYKKKVLTEHYKNR